MQIFFSHSSRDKPLIREIIARLPTYISNWLDEEKLLFGDELEPSLELAIQNEADFVVLFVSRDSQKSHWVQRELKWALAKEKRIGTPFVLPVVLDQGAWASIRPATLRKRRYLTCSDLTEAGVAMIAGQLHDELSQWIVRHYDRQKVAQHKAPVDVSLAGRWKSTFTWEPRHAGDSGESSDTIDVTQTGAHVMGETLKGDYSYSFQGRIVGEYLLGEWTGLKLPLFGVFQLKLDIDFLSTVEGYWIGNGSRLPYHGKWTWNRVEGKPGIRSTGRPKAELAPRNKSVRKRATKKRSTKKTIRKRGSGKQGS